MSRHNYVSGYFGLFEVQCHYFSLLTALCQLIFARNTYIYNMYTGVAHRWLKMYMGFHGIVYMYMYSLTAHSLFCGSALNCAPELCMF